MTAWGRDFAMNGGDGGKKKIILPRSNQYTTRNFTRRKRGVNSKIGKGMDIGKGKKSERGVNH